VWVTCPALLGHAALVAGAHRLQRDGCTGAHAAQQDHGVQVGRWVGGRLEPPVEDPHVLHTADEMHVQPSLVQLSPWELAL
jgi:hypothetical protein